MSTYLNEEQKQTVIAYLRPHFPDCDITVRPVEYQGDSDIVTIDCGGQRSYVMFVRREATAWGIGKIQENLKKREAASRIVEYHERGETYEWPNRADLGAGHRGSRDTRATGA